jgi:hypothetical protein
VAIVRRCPRVERVKMITTETKWADDVLIYCHFKVSITQIDDSASWTLISKSVYTAERMITPTNKREGANKQSDYLSFHVWDSRAFDSDMC